MTKDKVLLPTIHLINTNYHSPGVTVAIGLDTLLGGLVVAKSKRTEVSLQRCS